MHNILSNHDLISRRDDSVILAWVGLTTPPPIWAKLNTDGCVNPSLRTAGGGGLLQDHKRNWIAGFTANLGNCSVMEVELWAFLIGLRLA